MERKLTEMSRARFCELLDGIQDGSLLERWSGEKEPQAKAERVEARQIMALGSISRQRPLSSLLLMKWSRLEIITDGENLMMRLRK